MESKRCIACGEAFYPRAQRPDQQFCALPGCQRERKRLWQRARLRGDPDYRDNQARAQRAWVKRNAGYWRRYRQHNPAYAEANRARQRKRDARACAQGGLAKMDVSTPHFPFPSGTYQLSPVGCGNLAKMDVWTVEICLASTP